MTDKKETISSLFGIPEQSQEIEDKLHHLFSDSIFEAVLAECTPEELEQINEALGEGEEAFYARFTNLVKNKPAILKTILETIGLESGLLDKVLETK
ncbi:MAG TPA: hypothetical protein VJJ72_00755 [Candidatus Paceibacterota bacterium]